MEFKGEGYLCLSVENTQNYTKVLSYHLKGNYYIRNSKYYWISLSSFKNVFYLHLGRIELCLHQQKLRIHLVENVKYVTTLRFFLLLGSPLPTDVLIPPLGNI